MNFPSLAEVIVFVALFVIGMIVLSVLSVLLGPLPAIIAAVVVYLLFKSLIYAGIVFVVVAFLWVLVKRK